MTLSMISCRKKGEAITSAGLLAVGSGTDLLGAGADMGTLDFGASTGSSTDSITRVVSTSLDRRNLPSEKCASFRDVHQRWNAGVTGARLAY